MTDKEEIENLKKELEKLKQDFNFHNHDGKNSQSLKDVSVQNLNVTGKCKVGGVAVP